MIKTIKYGLFGIATVGLLVLLLPNSEPQYPKIFTTNVDPLNKIINDLNDDRESPSPFFSGTVKSAGKWLFKNFNIWRFYQNLANPYSRYVVLDSGLRKEEVAEIFRKELKWGTDQANSFLAMDNTLSKRNMEGRYSPGGYLVPLNAEPETAYREVIRKFNKEVVLRYATSTTEIINMDTALKIASIIEREAAGAHDMKLISGIIWNRIFKEMNLEMDATIQYAKGNAKNGWWPKLGSKDKYISSPYNTYRNKGLPPTPISNVSIAAIDAALNPRKTACIFYLHDRRGNIHCSVTYEEHLANIKHYYGIR